MFLDKFFSLNVLSPGEIILRVALAAIFGFILGYNRSKKDKPLGYRVYIIVCVITTLITMMGIELNTLLKDNSESIVLDLGKIISGILTGIGFIGAGAIMRNQDDKEVIGTTTGACIWASGGLGIMLGFGLYYMAVVGFLVVAFTMIFLNDILCVFIKDKNLDKH